MMKIAPNMVLSILLIRTDLVRLRRRGLRVQCPVYPLPCTPHHLEKGDGRVVVTSQMQLQEKGAKA